MPIAAYPATLPCPQTLTSTLAESRLLSEQPAQQARAISKERLAVVSLSWTLTDVQAATFVDWFDDDIEFGGSWFTATWPTPEGLLLTRSYRFSGRLAWNFIPGGFWTVSAVCEVQRPYVPPPPPSDPYFASVGLLLHCDVQNLDSGLYYLVDASSAARTCRSTGPAGQSIDTTIKKFGAGSVKNTSGNLLILVGGPPPLAPRTGDFTVELWSYVPAAAMSGGGFTSYYAQVAAPRDFTFSRQPGSTRLFIQRHGASDIVSGLNPSYTADTWHFISWCRNAGVSYLHIDGSLVFSFADTQDYGDDANAFNAFYTFSATPDQYFDDLRVTLVARYTAASYTIPTSAFLDS